MNIFLTFDSFLFALLETGLQLFDVTMVSSQCDRHIPIDSYYGVQFLYV